MATRRRIIEGTWTCTSCGTKGIPGRHKTCPTCGNPREQAGGESTFDFGGADAESGRSLGPEVKDEEALELAAAGADWFCVYCGAGNRGDQPRCRNCNAERAPDAPALAPTELRPRPPEPAAPPQPPVRKAGRGRWVLLVLALGALGFWLWGRKTREVTGTVARTEWKRAVVRETFERVTKEGWREELRPQASRLPVNGLGELAGVENVRGCVQRQRGTRQVPDGTERVCSERTRRVQCGTEERCSRRDLGNGFAEEVCHDVPRYCSEPYTACEDRTRYRTVPVFGLLCRYDTYAWTAAGREALEGQDSAPRWPALQAGARDRLKREEQYRVVIAYPGRRGGTQEHTLEPTSEAELLRWRPGQQVRLTVNNLGGVGRVEPAR